MPGTKQSGRRKEPTMNLIKKGSRWAKNRKNEPDPLDVSLMQMPPDYSELEKQLWEYHFIMTKNMRILSASDFSMLDMFCRTYAEYLELEKLIKQQGWTFKDDRGEDVLRPEVKLRNDTRKELRALCVQFGFSPSSRTSVKVEKQNINPFAITGNKWAIR